MMLIKPVMKSKQEKIVNKIIDILQDGCEAHTVRRIVKMPRSTG